MQIQAEAGIKEENTSFSNKSFY